MFWVGRDLKVQALSHLALGTFQEWGSQSFSRQPVPGSCHLHGEEFLPNMLSNYLPKLCKAENVRNFLSPLNVYRAKQRAYLGPEGNHLLRCPGWDPCRCHSAWEAGRKAGCHPRTHGCLWERLCTVTTNKWQSIVLDNVDGMSWLHHPRLALVSAQMRGLERRTRKNGGASRRCLLLTNKMRQMACWILILN